MSMYDIADWHDSKSVGVLPMAVWGLANTMHRWP